MVVNSRFAVFDGVTVPDLASVALGLAARQLPDDWHQKYSYHPVLIETFVDTTRFVGSSCKAADWQCIGQTQPLAGKSRKDVCWKRLVADFRRILRKEDPAPHKARHDLQCGAMIDETITEPWQKLVTAASGVAATCDAQWQTRRRAIDSLLIMLFVYHLVINRQGHAITLSQLWRQCQMWGATLPVCTGLGGRHVQGP